MAGLRSVAEGGENAQRHPNGHLGARTRSDTVKVEVNAYFYSSICFSFCRLTGARARHPPATQGFSALAGMMSDIGPIAIGVLVLLLIASLYSWMVILGKTSTFRKATGAEQEVHSRVPQGARGCRTSRRWRATTAPARWRRSSRMYTRPTSGRREGRDLRATWRH